MRTLLLDSSFSPVEVIDWKRAIILLLTGRAEAIDNYEDISIRSPRLSLQLPKTLRLFNLHRSARTVKFSRFNIIFRDNFECQYCGQGGSVKDLTIDHVIPVSRGGQNTWENVVTACGPCNSKKGNRLLREMGVKLKRDPYKPKWTPQIVIKMRENDPSEWRNWLPKKYRLAA